MYFFTFSNIEIDFVYRHLYKKTYTIAKILSTSKQIELIRKKEFVTTAPDLKEKAFIVYVTFISKKSDVYQALKVQITSLKVNETSNFISSKNTDFVDIISKELAVKLLENT